MIRSHTGVAFGLTVTVCAAMLAQGSRSQSVTATAVAHTALSVSASPNAQTLAAGADLTAGAFLSLSAGPAFDPGSASMVVSLATAPTLAYRIDAAASFAPTTPQPAPTCSYAGETLLTVTPQGGALAGFLRITFEHQGGVGSAGPANAAVDVGNDGSIEWTQAGGQTQVHIIPVSQSGPLLVRTITSGAVPGTNGLAAVDGDLLIEFLPTDVFATATALTTLSASSGSSSQSVPAGTDLGGGISLNASIGGFADAEMTVQWDWQSSLAYTISNRASDPFGLWPASNYSGGETLLTISPWGGYLQGTLRITFSYSSSGAPGSASIDVDNDGTFDWTAAPGGNPQVAEIPISRLSPLLVRTMTSAVAPAGGGSQSLTLRIEYLRRPFWNEAGDAGETRPTAQIPRGIGPMESIAGTIGADDCDMFWIHVDDPASFEATTVGGAGFDTQLWLFDRFGHGVSFHDDTSIFGAQSRLTSQFVHSPGNYLIAITRYDRDARSAAGDIWLDGPVVAERQPDGPGAGAPLSGWTGTTTAGGSYTIVLTGVSFPEMGRLLAVDQNRGLWAIAPETGETLQIGTVSSNVWTPEALAYDPIRDVLFLSNGVSLYSLQPDTALATRIGSFGTALRDLTFDLSTGQLYALAGFPPFTPNQLYRVDPSTAVATLVGSTSLPSTADALIHDPRSNTLLALSGGSTYAVDRLTGATALIGSSGIANPLQGTRHADTGLAYVLDGGPLGSSLRVLDLETGDNASIGAITPTQLRGLAFVPARSGVADYGTGCAGQGGVSPVLRAVGPFPLTGSMTYELSGCAPLSLGFFAFGLEPVWVPLPFPGACPVHISPLIHIDGLFVTAPGSPGSGTATFTVPLVPSSAGLELATQGVVLESIDINQMRTSNGVLILQ